MMLKKKPINEEQALKRLADLCARTEQCEFDVIRKLKLWGLSTDSVSKIIDRLRKDRFVDNSRFAHAFANDKVKFSRWGKKKIGLALAAKRIDSSTIREALEDIDEDEYTISLKAAATSKARSLNLNNPEEKHKLFACLYSRGFESTLINRMIAQLSRGIERNKE